MNLAYNSVALVTALDTISSSSGHSFVRLSSELAPVPSLLSNIYRLSSDCDFVCLRHVSITLVAGLKTISPLSSYSLSPILKFLFSSSPGLYSWSSSSYSKCPSSIPFSVPTTAPSFKQSIASSTLYSTRLIDNIMFLQFNTESFLFDSYDHINDHGVVLLSRIQPYSSHLSILYTFPLLPIIQNMCPL